MFEEALAYGVAAEHSLAQGAALGLIATFEASISSMSAELLDRARQYGRRIELRTSFVPEAMQDLAQGRAAEHHRKIAEAARTLRGCHVVMLAQFSIAFRPECRGTFCGTSRQRRRWPPSSGGRWWVLTRRSAAELLASARKAPGQINYGSGGNGSPQHIAMALFASQAGVSMTRVPYKGATQAAMGVAGNEVHAAFQGIATVNSLVRAGKVRLIGVTTPRRMPQFADVPTVSESGLPGFEFNSWFALMAPAGTPKAIVQTLRNEISQALADPEVREKLVAQGLTPRGTSPDELAKDMRAQLARYGALIKQAGITAE